MISKTLPLRNSRTLNPYLADYTRRKQVFTLHGLSIELSFALKSQFLLVSHSVLRSNPILIIYNLIAHICEYEWFCWFNCQNHSHSIRSWVWQTKITRY